MSNLGLLSSYLQGMRTDASPTWGYLGATYDCMLATYTGCEDGSMSNLGLLRSYLQGVRTEACSTWGYLGATYDCMLATYRV